MHKAGRRYENLRAAPHDSSMELLALEAEGSGLPW